MIGERAVFAATPGTRMALQSICASVGIGQCGGREQHYTVGSIGVCIRTGGSSFEIHDRTESAGE